MNKTKSTLGVFAAVLFVIACATAGQAQIQRSYVAGPGIGNDANAASPNFCNFPTPCRNFSAAYGVTNAGGEIVALSPVGYGGLTITHSITIQAAPGQYAFIAVVPSSSGIVVSAGASDIVILRNIQFAGAPALGAGSAGITHTSGKLIVDGCFFTGLALGFSTVVKADIINSNFSSNTTAIKVDGQGSISNGATGTAATTMLRMTGGNINDNTTAFIKANPGYDPCTPGFVCGCPGGPAPNQNARENIFLFGLGGSFMTSISGNTNFMQGSGATCTSGVQCDGVTTSNLCTGVSTFQSNSNPNN